MFCKICGRGVQPEDRFCSGCGAAIAQEPFESAASSSNSTAAAELSIAPRAHEHTFAARPDASADVASGAPPLTLPDTSPAVHQFRRCPRCRRLNTGTDLCCDWCGTELPANAPAPALGPAANIAPPSFAGYAETNLTSKTEEANLTVKAAASDGTSKTNPAAGVIPRSRPPVLEILVIVLLLAGAATAVWILRSSIPDKPAAKPSSVVVTISPESAEVVAGKAFDFSATVSGTDDTEVIWTVEEGDGGGRIVSRGAKAKDGTVSSLAVYVAPSTPGTYHLVATSEADPQQSASAEATVTRR
ncbi:MAG: hypothetical protein WAM65_12075 [Candidatus Korobacteraceae bacterium]